MPSRRDENYANMQRYNSVMHRALLALLAAAGLFAQQLPFDAQALLELARIGDPQVSPYALGRQENRVAFPYKRCRAGGMTTMLTCSATILLCIEPYSRFSQPPACSLSSFLSTRKRCSKGSC